MNPTTARRDRDGSNQFAGDVTNGLRQINRHSRSDTGRKLPSLRTNLCLKPIDEPKQRPFAEKFTPAAIICRIAKLLTIEQTEINGLVLGCASDLHRGIERPQRFAIANFV